MNKNLQTIQINVPLTVKSIRQDTRLGPYQQGLGSLRSTSGFVVQKRIEAVAYAGVGRVEIEVVITGDPRSIQEMLDEPSPLPLIQRALSALGYVVGDHQKDVVQFSRWVDHLVEFPRTDEAKAIWTEAMLRLFGSDSPPLVPSTIAEASGACGALVVEQMRLFPPRISGMDLGTEAWAELQEWRSAAKESGIESAKELAESGKIDFGRFVDRKVNRDWQFETGCATPTGAGELARQRQSTILEQRKTCVRIQEEAAQRDKAWRDATGRQCPGDAEQRIEDFQMQSKMQAETIRQWADATGCDTPESAKSNWAGANGKIRVCENELTAWSKATGADSPEAAIDRARVTHDSWQEATGAVDSHAAYKKINDLETKLLSYASEIDALRKANTQSLVSDTVSGREYAKVKAELDSKRRECATEKELADRLECESNKRGVLLAKISEALQVNNLPLIWDPLPGQVAYVKEQQQLEKMRADSESSLRAKQETWLNSIRDALGNKLLAFKDLSEHISDLKRAYDALDIGVFAPEDVADEAKVIREIIVSHLSNAGIESAAGAIAGRTVSLSASWGKTLEARKILQAKPGEGIVDAAVRITSTAWRTNNELESAIIEARKAAGIDHEKAGSGSYTSLAQWCGAAREKLANAIIPLPKPEKVEAGQKWAIRIGFVDAYGQPWFYGPNSERATLTRWSPSDFTTVATYLGQ